MPAWKNVSTSCKIMVGSKRLGATDHINVVDLKVLQFVAASS